MPWREVVRLMLKKKFAVACFFVMVISALIAVFAGFLVSDMDLRSNPGVDNAENYRNTVRARLTQGMDEEPTDEQVDEEISERDLNALTGLERSYHPPGWALAWNPDHPHWKKTGRDPDSGEERDPVPMDERDWGFFSAKAWRFPMGCDIEGVSILSKLIRGLQLRDLADPDPARLSPSSWG